MAAAEALSDNHFVNKAGSKDEKTNASFPKITGVFSARNDQCYVPYQNKIELHVNAHRFLDAEAFNNEGLQEMRNEARPAINPVQIYEETSTNNVIPICQLNGWLSSAPNRTVHDNSTVMHVETGLASNMNDKSVGGLFTIDWEHFGARIFVGDEDCNRSQGHNPFLRPQQPKVFVSSQNSLRLADCGDENMRAKTDRLIDLPIPFQQYPSLFHFDEIKRRIPFRFGLEKDPFKKTLHSNFSEVVELYKVATQCGDSILSESEKQKQFFPTKYSFSWEDIQQVLEKDVSGKLEPSLLSDLVDLRALVLILKHQNYDYDVVTPTNVSSRSGYNMPTMQHSSSKALEKGLNIIKEKCAHIRSLSSSPLSAQAKNVTSIPYAKKQMEAMLRSSKVEEHSRQVCSPGTAQTTRERTRPSTSDLLTASQIVDLKEKGGDFYLGRYPCLRDRAHWTTDDRPLGNESPILLSDDPAEESPEMIIRPRTYSESYEESYEHEKEEFPSLDQFSGRQTGPGQFAVRQNMESTLVERSIQSLQPSSSATSMDTSSLSEGSMELDVDNSATQSLTQVPGFRPIAPKLGGSGVANTENTSKG